MKQALIIVFFLLNVTIGMAQKPVIASPVAKVPTAEQAPDISPATVKKERVYRNTDSIRQARIEAIKNRTQQRKDSLGVKPFFKRNNPVVRNENTTKQPTATSPQTQSSTTSGANPVAATAPYSDIDFTVTNCVGDKNAQTVTVFFTFSNTRKAHQKIWIGSHLQKEYKKRAMAFDAAGNQYGFGGGTLGSETSGNYKAAETQLPTGVPVNGSIKYTNILPTVNKLSLVNIPSGSANWAGGKDKKEAIIEVKDLTINWQ